MVKNISRQCTHEGGKTEAEREMFAKVVNIVVGREVLLYGSPLEAAGRKVPKHFKV